MGTVGNTYDKWQIITYEFSMCCIAVVKKNFYMVFKGMFPETID